MLAQKKLFEGMSPMEIRELLENTCLKKEKQTIEIPLTDQDVADLEKSVSKLSAEVADLENKKSEYAAKINVELKPKKVDLRIESLSLASGQKVVDSDIYLLEDHESNQMNYFRPDGTLHSSRRLLPSERQLRIT